jgi:glc operon protein GlcG
VQVAQEKARTAVLFKRPSKALEDAVSAGRIVVMALAGAVPVEGGVPIVAEDQLIGAIGVSGATSPQDGQVAAAGLAAFRPA